MYWRAYQLMMASESRMDSSAFRGCEYTTTTTDNSTTTTNRDTYQLEYEPGDPSIFDNIINNYDKAQDIDGRDMGEMIMNQEHEQRVEIQMMAQPMMHVVPDDPTEKNDAIKRHMDYLTTGQPIPSPSLIVPKQELAPDSPTQHWITEAEKAGPSKTSTTNGASIASSAFDQHVINERRSSSDNALDSDSEKLISNIIKKEPIDMSDIIQKRSKRGRKRKTADSEDSKLDRISDDYRRKRERNNIAVRKSRDKAKLRQQERENQLVSLANEVNTLSEIVKRQKETINRQSESLERLNSHIRTLPTQYVPSWFH